MLRKKESKEGTRHKAQGTRHKGQGTRHKEDPRFKKQEEKKNEAMSSKDLKFGIFLPSPIGAQSR
jgi:hypothetical protein